MIFVWSSVLIFHSWESGENHLLFNMVPRVNGIMELKSDRAIIAGAYFDGWSYRTGFDFILPLLGYERDRSIKAKTERLGERYEMFHYDYYH